MSQRKAKKGYHTYATITLSKVSTSHLDITICSSIDAKNHSEFFFNRGKAIRQKVAANSCIHNTFMYVSMWDPLPS